VDNREEVALAALARMVDQYLEKRPDGMIDNYAMSAGESALEALSAYGYMEDAGMRFARWTELGRHSLHGRIFQMKIHFQPRSEEMAARHPEDKGAYWATKDPACDLIMDAAEQRTWAIGTGHESNRFYNLTAPPR